MNLEKKFKQKIENLNAAQRFLVGFSGGLDSSVLLYLLSALKLSTPIIGIHVNHQLSPKAASWQLHCEEVCAKLGVELITESVQVESTGEGLESAARLQRYGVFETYIERGDVLVLGHHLDDQIETMLFRLMRGTGPKGLAGIAEHRSLGDGLVVRPLLSVAKNELQIYAKQNQITWIEDDSNDESKFDRNYLRNEVIPLLEKRWPNFSKRWLQTAESCREEHTLCRTMAEEDLVRANELQERWGFSIRLQSLNEMSKERRNNILRAWVDKHGYPQLEVKHLDEIDKQFFNAESTKAEFTWGKASLRRYKQKLYLTPPDSEEAQARIGKQPLTWNLSETLCLPDGSKLNAKFDDDPPADDMLVTVRWRRGGERCKPRGRGHSQSIKKLLQEYGLEPWLRERVPLIYRGEDLIAVGDLWLCDLGSAPMEAKNLNFTWQLF